MFSYRLASLWAMVLGFAVSIASNLHLQSAEPSYDPLAVDKSQPVETLSIDVKDAKRNRTIPLRVYLPASPVAAPVILFSHGLGGSRDDNPYLGEHWSRRGYIVVFMQHVGSDESVWKDAALLSRLNKLKQAANLQNTLLRLKDVPAVIDQLERWNQATDSPLGGRLDVKHIGMSGHSFGAVTTQGVSGQCTPRGEPTFTDARIKAAIAMSPNSPKNGSDPKVLFGKVKIPWLLMTGTNDTGIIGDATVESRRAVYPALPAGEKYELVLEGAQHEAFGDRDLPGAKSERNPNHHLAILAISTAFWDASLRADSVAHTWLLSDEVRKVLDEKDRWQHK